MNTELLGSKSGVRNVIFDLGGVVLEWNPDAILASYYADVGLRATMKLALFQHPDWLRMDQGTLTEADVLPMLEKRTGRPTAELIGLFEAIRSSLQPKVDTVALIQSIAQRDISLYCLSNMPTSTFEYLRGQYNFWQAFRGIVISGEIKMMKPERRIFDYLLCRFNLSPAETVFIDDHRQNIEAARELGLHTIWFQDANQCEAELEHLLGLK